MSLPPPPGIGDPVKLVSYLLEVARILGVFSNPGDTNKWVLDSLRGLVQQGFAPIQYEFEARI